MLVGLLDELEERDLVERKRDPNDRRRHLVRLTPEGKKTLKRLRGIAAQVDDDFFAPLDAEERAALHDLLHRLAQVHEPRCAPLKPSA
jgi:DNA-binding MarR family transcriptional regulator